MASQMDTATFVTLSARLQDISVHAFVRTGDEDLFEALSEWFYVLVNVLEGLGVIGDEHYEADIARMQLERDLDEYGSDELD